jgi:hypothetical protein
LAAVEEPVVGLVVAVPVGLLPACPLEGDVALLDDAPPIADRNAAHAGRGLKSECSSPKLASGLAAFELESRSW